MDWLRKNSFQLSFKQFLLPYLFSFSSSLQVRFIPIFLSIHPPNKRSLIQSLPNQFRGLSSHFSYLGILGGALIMLWLPKNQSPLSSVRKRSMESRSICLCFDLLAYPRDDWFWLIVPLARRNCFHSNLWNASSSETYRKCLGLYSYFYPPLECLFNILKIRSNLSGFHQRGFLRVTF